MQYLPVYLSPPLQRIQNSAARLIEQLASRAHVTKLTALRELHWLPVKTTGQGDVRTELPLATETLDHFQPCTADEVKSVNTAAPSKSCTLDPLPTDMLKRFLPELLPSITDLCNASLKQGCLHVVSVTPSLPRG